LVFIVLVNLLFISGNSDPAVAQKQLIQHLIKLARGNFLYLRLCLDLIDQGAIVLKSSGFKVIPVDLDEVGSFRSYTDNVYLVLARLFVKVLNQETARKALVIKFSFHLLLPV